MRKTSLALVHLLPLLAVGLVAATPGQKELFADQEVADAQNTLTPEQLTALAAVDVRLASVEALAAKIEDTDYRATVARQIESLKDRRLALEKNFDPALQESLMHSVISRYQVIALWLKPPSILPPATGAHQAVQDVEIGNNCWQVTGIFRRARRGIHGLSVFVPCDILRTRCQIRCP